MKKKNILFKVVMVIIGMTISTQSMVVLAGEEKNSIQVYNTGSAMENTKDDNMIEAEIISTDSNISLYNTYTKATTISLSYSGGSVKCSASVTGYMSVSSVSITMTLQKQVNGSWVNQYVWSGSDNSYTMTLSKSVTASSGTYRLKVVYYAGTEKTEDSVSKSF